MLRCSCGGTRAAVLASLLLLSWLFAPLSTAAAADCPSAKTTVFGLAPASAIKGPGQAKAVLKVDGRPYFNYVVSPGAKLADNVAVVNTSCQPVTLRLYATDATNAPDGSFAYPAQELAPKEAGRWLTVTTPNRSQEIVIPARTTRVYPVQVVVPADAGPGDHGAAIIVSLNALSRNGTGQRVTLDQRVAARVFFHVSGALHPGLAIQGLKASYHAHGALSGTVDVSYRVHNSGNVKLGGRQAVSVSGLFTGSSQAGTLVQVLLPGGDENVTAQIKGVRPQVWMRAKVRVTPLAVTGDVVPPTPDAVATVHVLAIPWLLLLALLVVIVLIVGGTVYWRRRPVKAPGAAAPEPPSKHRAGAALRMIAVLGLAGWAAVGPGAGLASAAPSIPPYIDPAVTGPLGLCDVNGHNVMSGHLADKPFVWRAVGTTAAKAPYNAPGSTAILAAYQPRQGIDPGNWSGKVLSAASVYSNPAHPMAQMVPTSDSIGAFVYQFPAVWDGYVELRLLLSGPNESGQIDTYDATDIQVTGDTWHVVRGGTGPCTDGQAISRAVTLHLKGATGTPKPGAIAPRPSVTQSAVPQSVLGTPAPGTSPPPGDGTSSSDQASAVTGHGVSSASNTTLIVAGIGIAVVASGITLWAARRRPSS